MGRKAEPHSIRTIAASLGLPRSTLHRLKKRHGLNLADPAAVAALLADGKRRTPTRQP